LQTHTDYIVICILPSYMQTLGLTLHEYCIFPFL